MFITLKASSVHDNKNGTVQIEVASKDLTAEEHLFLNKMFPHLVDSAHALLEKEALLAALATDANCAVPCSDNLACDHSEIADVKPYYKRKSNDY